MKIKFENVIIVGPSSNRKGGIAWVLKKYKANFKLRYFSSTNFQSTFLSFLCLPERLISFVAILLFNNNIKVVHIHGSSQGSFFRKYFFYKISKLFKKKVIYHIHSGRFLKFHETANKVTKKLIENIINNTDVLIVLSESWKTGYTQRFNPKAIDVIPNLIDKPTSVIKKQKENFINRINVVFLGKIVQSKGVYDLLDCIVENYEFFSKSMTFTICGIGETEQMRKYKDFDKYGLINFTGWVGSKEKEKILSNSDILILPSYSEGLPVSILEGMSYKMAVVATNVGGIPDIIQHNRNGFLFNPGDKSAMFDILKKYSTEPKLVIDHGEENYKKVVGHFPENVKNELNRIYNTI
jgi:glycosyltransferase involved in cell wall biosynthesis